MIISIRLVKNFWVKAVFVWQPKNGMEQKERHFQHKMGATEKQGKRKVEKMNDDIEVYVNMNSN